MIMRTLTLAGLIAAAIGTAAANAQPTEELIAQAVRPLPEDLRTGAGVYRYDPTTGRRVVVRQGTNHIECIPEDENGFARCETVRTAARRDFAAKLTAEGVTGEALQAKLAEAERVGTIEAVSSGSVLYRAHAKDSRIQLLWVVRLPNVTSQQLALPTASQRDRSLAGQGLPWMMLEGTPAAHLMIPINGTTLSNAGGAKQRADTKTISDPVEQALLPLSDDLKAGATVVRYDMGTGERHVLRQGSNMIECQPLDAATKFIRCYHISRAAELELRAKLSSRGKSSEEIESDVAAAIAAGTIAAQPFGAMSYRLYQDDDRIKYLWVLRLPNATAEELGLSTASQRDDALAGHGLPWMMREGTPAAHLMIPINGTELSN
jgi:hypothetical protein